MLPRRTVSGEDRVEADLLILGEGPDLHVQPSGGPCRRRRHREIRAASAAVMPSGYLRWSWGSDNHNWTSVAAFRMRQRSRLPARMSIQAWRTPLMSSRGGPGRPITGAACCVSCRSAALSVGVVDDQDPLLIDNGFGRTCDQQHPVQAAQHARRVRRRGRPVQEGARLGESVLGLLASPGENPVGAEVLSGVAGTDGDPHTRALGWSMPLLNWTSSRSPTVASMTGPGTCPLKP